MKSILVVDDSATNLRFVESVLKDDYKLILVKSGQQAIKYLEKHVVDLVLLDLIMPEMDGFETYEKIKGLDINYDVPIVFLTADVDVETEIKGLKMGAVDFIRKPFVPEVMINRINNILQLEELTEELERKVEEKTGEIEQLSFEIMVTIASMIEAKDQYTKGHSVRVAEYSVLLAQKLGWNKEEIQNIRYIGLLHDIGKIGIPDDILNKPGKLTDAEMEVVKSHTVIGGKILKDIESIMHVDSGAKFHHERYDGTGYPCGLVGEEIPLVARIISIADAYDAMNSKRIYRRRLKKDEIIRELQNGKGTQFDPYLVDIFIQLLEDGKMTLDLEKMDNETILYGESSQLLNQIMQSIEEESKKNEEVDYLTGLLNRKAGERKMIDSMQEVPGCLAFIDLDNLKCTNDTMGHLAGDFALVTIGQVLMEFAEDAVIARIGGDEFIYYMIGADKGTATKRVEAIIEEFNHRKEQNTYLSVSSLSIGLCTTTPEDVYTDVLQKADKALYHIKQSGKCGYYFHPNTPWGVSQKKSVDLEKLVLNLRKQGAYTGTLNVEYREFAKFYEYVKNLAKRYEYKIQLVMVTLESKYGNNCNIDAQEHIMNIMKKAIQDSLRNVDVSTRLSGEQFLVVLLNAGEEDIQTITKRIQENFYAAYDKKMVSIKFDIADLEKL